MEPFEFAGLILASLFACTAAAWDIRHRTIPNWLCLGTAMCGLLTTALTFNAADLLMHAAHSVVAMIVGIALFALRWWGGGDAKFYAAVATWFSITDFFPLIFWISLAGLVLVLGLFVLRRFKKRPAGEAGKAIPYGVAIAAGMIATRAAAIALS